jgi:hypothetical protein
MTDLRALDRLVLYGGLLLLLFGQVLIAHEVFSPGQIEQLSPFYSGFLIALLAFGLAPLFICYPRRQDNPNSGVEQR